MDDKGFIVIYRSMKKWEWYQDTNTKVVFLHLLLNANWDVSRYKGYEIPRGGLVIGLNSLSKSLKLSVQQVRTALDHLKSTNEITIKTTNRFSIVTIVNWEKYQGNLEELTSKSTSRLTNNQQTTNKQLTTEEQYNNITIEQDKEKNIKKESRTDYQEIIDLYHQNCPSLPKVTKITDARKKLINARLKDYSLGELVNAFAVAEASDFLKHGNGTWNGANFDWIMNPNNIVKILEGNYANKTNTKSGYDLYRETKRSNYDFDALERETKYGSN